MTVSPGIHLNVPHDDYIADPCDTPSLNAGTCKTLLTASPRHAWTGHAKLNPEWEPSNNPTFDIGSAAHTYYLQDGRGIAEIHHESWRTKDAKEQREAAIATGKVPLLTHHHEQVKAMAAALKAQLSQHEVGDPMEQPGESEVTLIWNEGATLCRARIDRMPEVKGTTAIVYDYKTTATSVAPDSIVRYAEQQQWMIQAEFYSRGVAALYGVERVVFRFVAQENKPPYAVSVLDFTPMSLGFAERKVRYALGVWQQCLSTDTWPGYDRRVISIEPPEWAQAAWQDREDRGHASVSVEAISNMLHWQAPIRPIRDSSKQGENSGTENTD